MKIFLLWDEDSHLVHVSLEMRGAITYLKNHHETDVIERYQFVDNTIEFEVEGARYRIEEREAT